MPLYEFEDPEGNLLELRRPVSKRNTPVVVDGITYVRARSVPVNISIRCPGPTADQQFNERIRKGFYRHEQEQGSAFKGVENLNKTQLKSLWEDRSNEVRH
jgi:hypothetical protein